MIAQDIVKRVYYERLVADLRRELSVCSKRDSLYKRLEAGYVGKIKVLSRKDSLRSEVVSGLNRKILLQSEELRYMKRRRFRNTLLAVGGVTAAFFIGRSLK